LHLVRSNDSSCSLSCSSHDPNNDPPSSQSRPCVGVRYQGGRCPPPSFSLFTPLIFYPWPPPPISQAISAIHLPLLQRRTLRGKGGGGHRLSCRRQTPPIHLPACLRLRLHGVLPGIRATAGRGILGGGGGGRGRDGRRFPARGVPRVLEQVCHAAGGGARVGGGTPWRRGPQGPYQGGLRGFAADGGLSRGVPWGSRADLSPAPAEESVHTRDPMKDQASLEGSSNPKKYPRSSTSLRLNFVGDSLK